MINAIIYYDTCNYFYDPATLTFVKLFELFDMHTQQKKLFRMLLVKTFP